MRSLGLKEMAASKKSSRVVPAAKELIPESSAAYARLAFPLRTKSKINLAGKNDDNNRFVMT